MRNQEGMIELQKKGYVAKHELRVTSCELRVESSEA